MEVVAFLCLAVWFGLATWVIVNDEVDSAGARLFMWTLIAVPTAYYGWQLLVGG